MKTSASNIIARIQRRIDYDIDDSDLEDLIVDCINDALKVMKQLFLDNGLYDEIGAEDSFSTTADQNYVNIASETVDFDQPIILYEKTNDTIIPIIPHDEFILLYPDDSANKSTTPNHASFFANKLFLGPTPSSVITLFLSYIKLISDITSSGNLPFENHYDPLVIAMCIQSLTSWLDSKNSIGIAQANRQVEILKKELIIGASKNIGMRRTMPSRKFELPYFAPRKVTTN